MRFCLFSKIERYCSWTIWTVINVVLNPERTKPKVIVDGKDAFVLQDAELLPVVCTDRS